MKRRIVFISLAALACGILSCVTNGQGRGPKQKAFTQAEVSEIQSVLKELDPKNYHVVLPKFKDGRIVGSETYGQLPVAQVRRLASISNIAYDNNGNLQAVLCQCNGGGAGSHVDSKSGGHDISNRIESIVQNISRSEYNLLLRP
jgi:hypothetical protein